MMDTNNDIRWGVAIIVGTVLVTLIAIWLLS
jgi:hypothetical protein